jgi:hypothetical protein
MAHTNIMSIEYTTEQERTVYFKLLQTLEEIVIMYMFP